MWSQKPSFRFEIDNFSEKEVGIPSPIFKSGGCHWYLNVYPKGATLANDYLSLYLVVGNYKSLGTGWRRRAKYGFVVYNQSEQELHRCIASNLFCIEDPIQGFRKTLPVDMLQKGFLENDKLIIAVYIEVIEAFDGQGVDVSKKKAVNINGFNFFPSQVNLARKIFEEHPDIAKDFKPKNQEVKTACMSVLLGLIETLSKPPQSLSETELSNAYIELSDLTEVGFKIEWLKSKLGEVCLEWKKSDVDGSQTQQLEERVNKLELKMSKLEEVSLERKKLAETTDGSRVQQLEKRVRNLELILADLKV